MQRNAIKACSVSPDRRLLVTACAGNTGSALIVWSTATGDALAAVEEPHPQGTVALAVSADSKLLASLSAPYPVSLTDAGTGAASGSESAGSSSAAGHSAPTPTMLAQELSIWVLPPASDDPGRAAMEGAPGGLQLLASKLLPAMDLQHSVAFNGVGAAADAEAAAAERAAAAAEHAAALAVGDRERAAAAAAASVRVPSLLLLHELVSTGMGSTCFWSLVATGLEEGVEEDSSSSSGSSSSTASESGSGSDAVGQANPLALSPLGWRWQLLCALCPVPGCPAPIPHTEAALAVAGAASVANRRRLLGLPAETDENDNASDTSSAPGARRPPAGILSKTSSAALVGGGAAASAASLAGADGAASAAATAGASATAGAGAGGVSSSAIVSGAGSSGGFAPYASLARHGNAYLRIAPGPSFMGFAWGSGHGGASSSGGSGAGGAGVSSGRKCTTTVFLPARTPSGSAAVSALTATTDGLVVLWSSEVDAPDAYPAAAALQADMEAAAAAAAEAREDARGRAARRTAGHAQGHRRSVSPGGASRPGTTLHLAGLGSDGGRGGSMRGRGPPPLWEMFPLAVYERPPRLARPWQVSSGAGSATGGRQQQHPSGIPVRTRCALLLRLASLLCARSAAKTVRLATRSVKDAIAAALEGPRSPSGAGGDGSGAGGGGGDDEDGGAGGGGSGGGGSGGGAGNAPPPSSLNAVLLSPSGRHLIFGCEDGGLRVFDVQLRLVAWWDPEELEAGPLTCVGFFPGSGSGSGSALTSGGAGAGGRGSAPGSPGGPGGDRAAAASAVGGVGLSGAALPRLLLASRRALLLALEPSSFDGGSAADRAGTVLLEGPDAPVAGIVSFPPPYAHLLAVAVASGCVQLWDMGQPVPAPPNGLGGVGPLPRVQRQPQLLAVRELIRPHGFAAGSAAAAAAALAAPQLFHPTCAALDRYCRFLGVGTAEGSVCLLDPLTLSDAQPPLQPASHFSAGGAGGAGNAYGSTAGSGSVHGHGAGGTAALAASLAGGTTALYGGQRAASPITHIAFGDDGIHLATGDAARHVALWRFVRRVSKQISARATSRLGLGKSGSVLTNRRRHHGSGGAETRSEGGPARPRAWELVDGDAAGLEDVVEDEWLYIGRAKAHGAAVTGLAFCPLPPGALSPFVFDAAARARSAAGSGSGASSAGSSMSSAGAGRAMKGGHIGGEGAFWDVTGEPGTGYASHAHAHAHAAMGGGGSMGDAYATSRAAAGGLLGQHRAAGLSLLASVGADRRLVLYDVGASSVPSGLVVSNHGAARYPVGQFAAPTACLWHPPGAPPTDSEPTAAAAADCIVVPTSDHKLRAWRLTTHPAALAAVTVAGATVAAGLFPGCAAASGPMLHHGSVSPVCTKTTLAPTLEGSLTHLVPVDTSSAAASSATLPPMMPAGRSAAGAGAGSGGAGGGSINVVAGADGGPELLAFGTSDRVIGVMLLPLSGSPVACLSVVAHAGPVTGLASTATGDRIYSCGLDAALPASAAAGLGGGAGSGGGSGGGRGSSGSGSNASGRAALTAPPPPLAAAAAATAFVSGSSGSDAWTGAGSVCVWALSPLAIRDAFASAAAVPLVPPSAGAAHAAAAATSIAAASAALAAAAEAGAGTSSFLSLVEGGADGPLHAELKDVFAYAQIRSQGEASTARRAVGTSLPLAEVPAVMRALGYFPTAADMAALHCEASGAAFSTAYRKALAAAFVPAAGPSPPGGMAGAIAAASAAGAAAALRSEVALPALTRMFVNHRPLAPAGRDALFAALRAIARYVKATDTGIPKSAYGGNSVLPSGAADPDNADDGIGAIRWAPLARLLAVRGERMLAPELHTCLTALLGPAELPPDRALPEGMEPTHFEEDDEITAPGIVNRVLGFSEA